jgi:hypothetical protein
MFKSSRKQAAKFLEAEAVVADREARQYRNAARTARRKGSIPEKDIRWAENHARDCERSARSLRGEAREVRRWWK